MPRRIEARRPDEARSHASARLEAERAAPLAPIGPDNEIETPALPRDLPAWARDAVAISQRARELLARLRPIVVRVLTFWDHRVRSALVGGRRLSVDPSGSYRIDR